MKMKKWKKIQVMYYAFIKTGREMKILTAFVSQKRILFFVSFSVFYRDFQRHPSKSRLKKKEKSTPGEVVKTLLQLVSYFKVFGGTRNNQSVAFLKFSQHAVPSLDINS